MKLYCIYDYQDKDSLIGIYDSEEEAKRVAKILNQHFGVDEYDDSADAYYYVCGPLELNSCGPTLDAIIKEETL